MIPSHLRSTFDLIERAFPAGVPDEDYAALLAELESHMSDENLALVVSRATGRELGLVMNDVLASGAGGTTTREARARVAAALLSAGFEQWLSED